MNILLKKKIALVVGGVSLAILAATISIALLTLTKQKSSSNAEETQQTVDLPSGDESIEAFIKAIDSNTKDAERFLDAAETQYKIENNELGLSNVEGLRQQYEALQPLSEPGKELLTH